MLIVRAKFFPLAFLLLFCKPRISINGTPPIVGTWGENHVPVAPGRYQVEVWIRYLFWATMGRNGIIVDVPPGAAVIVQWRAPLTVFTKGKIAVNSPASSVAPAPGVARGVPAGWYPDPSGRYRQRYYDGRAWTEHVMTDQGGTVDKTS